MISKRKWVAGGVVALGTLVSLQVGAVSTRSFVLDDAASLAEGDLEGVAVHSEGRVTAGVSVRRLELPDVAVAYCLARAPDGATYIGTGNGGKIFRLKGDSVQEFASTGQLLVSALVATGDAVYAGTLPGGRIFKFSTRGSSRPAKKPGPAKEADGGDGSQTEFAKLEGADHVWALAWRPSTQTLFAATGPQGQVFAINRNGDEAVVHDSAASHVMSLALDADGVLYAGTSDDALLLRIASPSDVRVVYDFPGNEVTAIAARDGVVVAAANDFPKSTVSTTATKKTTAVAKKAQKAGKGELWRIGRDGRVERVYKNDSAHFTAVQIGADGTLFAAAGSNGRVYRVAPDRTHATWIDVDERQVLDMDLVSSRPVFVTGDPGAVYRVDAARSQNAQWTSKVLDAKFLSRWGRIDWRATGNIEMQTRSGNTTEPDETWSEWSSKTTQPGPVRSPASRFLQARSFLGSKASLRAVQIYYLPQNQRATVHSVTATIHRPTAAKKAKPKAEASTEYAIEWSVDDPDGDELRFRIKFREERQRQWRDVLEPHEILTERRYTWDTAAIPDGYYVLRVEASDELVNPEVFALRASAESEPVLIDNHAPDIDGLAFRAGEVRGRVRDNLGPIAKLEYAIDGGRWRAFFPSDDLLDTREEQFRFKPDNLSPGSHIIAVRAVDSGGNQTSAELTVGGQALQ